MIIGESGTGKELVARALHDYGKRRDGAVRRGQHGGDPARADRERAVRPRARRLHRRRRRARTGRFEQAEGGTLFLDEIGDMPLEAQTRLLRVLQEGEYTTVGGRTPIKADVRIIAATNRDLRIADPAGAVPRGSVLPPERRAACACRRCASGSRTFPSWRGISCDRAQDGGPAGQDARAGRAGPAAARIAGPATSASWKT